MPIIRASVDIDLDDVWDECDDDDLLRECARRGWSMKDRNGATFCESSSVNEAIHFLAVEGLPRQLVDQLAEWARQPVATTRALTEWLRAAGKEVPSCGQ